MAQAQIQEGINLFNQNTDQGIARLIETGIIQANNAQSIVDFFRNNTETVEKAKVGEYLGGNTEIKRQVLALFVDSLNFEGIRLDLSLRQLLTHFSLPGESQQIDRIMERYGQKYSQDNPAVCSNGEGAYTLSYLLIMLSTDLHNPLIKQKMNFQTFTNMSKGIQGFNLDEALLQQLYSGIQQQPLIPIQLQI